MRFENVFVHVTTIARGRIRGIEIFAIDDVDRVLARFEELCG